MRGTSWLLLVAVAAIVFGVGIVYQRHKKDIYDHAQAAPPPLPDDVSSSTQLGTWTEKDQKTGCTSYQLTSKEMRKAADSTHSELSGVELRIYHKSTSQAPGEGTTTITCDTKFDLVHSDAATFFDSDNRLYAEGPVQITLGEPTEGEAPPNLISITSSGVTFDTKSGKADTERYTKFHF